LYAGQESQTRDDPPDLDEFAIFVLLPPFQFNFLGFPAVVKLSHESLMLGLPQAAVHLFLKLLSDNFFISAIFPGDTPQIGDPIGLLFVRHSCEGLFRLFR